MKLSARLSLIKSLIPKGSAVVDVGTDHAYLPAALSLEGGMRSISATDINQKPLSHAAETLKKAGIEDVELILCDGLSGVSRDLADTVIIAGMGGEVIGGIISRCSFLKDSGVLLILQPMTAAVYLREYLAQSGFKVEDEHAISENGKLYSVMRVRFAGEASCLTPAERFVGKLVPDSLEAIDYIRKQYDICRSVAACLEGIPEKREEYEQNLAAAADIKKLLEETHGS